jgi:hypothetical protein
VRLVIVSCGFEMIVNREPIGHDQSARLHILTSLWDRLL